MRHLYKTFPNLVDDDEFEVTSPRDNLYNCLAWAAKDENNWWSPIKPYYWPEEAPRTQSLDAYRQAYESIGFSECETPDYEEGYEKIAIYVDNSGKPKHAARQLEEEVWTSKCGSWEDIEHSLDGLDGNLYGQAVLFMKRELED